MLAIEAHNPGLKGVLPKDYNRPALAKVMLGELGELGELSDLISGIALGASEDKAKQLLGRIYEYFLSQFASAARKNGSHLPTPLTLLPLCGQTCYETQPN